MDTDMTLQRNELHIFCNEIPRLMRLCESRIYRSWRLQLEMIHRPGCDFATWSVFNAFSFVECDEVTSKSRHSPVFTLYLSHYITFSNDRNKWNKYVRMEDAVFDALDARVEIYVAATGQVRTALANLCTTFFYINSSTQQTNRKKRKARLHSFHCVAIVAARP